MKKKLLAIMLTACLALALLPTVALADAPVPIMSGKFICANGAALIVNGSDDTHTTVYIDADRDGVLDDGEQSLKQAGVANAPADDIDLSGNWICGGASSGNFTGDSMITINGGSVGSVYGGNHSGDLIGNVTIEMNGGSVDRLLACGYNNAVGDGSSKTVSVAIHGGTVRGKGADQSVNLESRNNASTTSLFIAGGTINGQISVKSSGSFVIKGGNILASFSGETPAPINSEEPPASIYKTTLTLMDGETVKADTAIAALTTNAGYTYSMNDGKTDVNGKLLVYLPAGTTVTAATTANGDSYENTGGAAIVTNADGTATGNLTKVIRTSLSGLSYNTASQELSVVYDPGAAAKDALLFAAAYANGRMTEVAMATASSAGGTVAFRVDAADEYKVFALDPDTYAPLCAAAHVATGSVNQLQ